jgi:hypothetical protein
MGTRSMTQETEPVAQISHGGAMASNTEPGLRTPEYEATLRAIVELYEQTKLHYYRQHPSGKEYGSDESYGVLCGMAHAAKLAERGLEK